MQLSEKRFPCPKYKKCSDATISGQNSAKLSNFAGQRITQGNQCLKADHTAYSNFHIVSVLCTTRQSKKQILEAAVRIVTEKEMGKA